MKRIVNAFGLGALVVFLGASAAQETKSISDKEFLVKSFECGVSEVKVSQLAENRTQNEKVREFARQMVKDHQNLNNQLAEQSKNLKLAVVGGLDPTHKEIYDRLAQLKGEDFDKAFMKQVVTNHEKAVRLYEAQAKGTSELRQFAETALPTLRAHLNHARSLADTVKNQ